MSYVPSQVSETLLMEQRFMADRMLLDSRIRLQYEPQIAAFLPLYQMQAANMGRQMNILDKKEYDVEITWLNACDDFAIEDVSCAIGGNEPSTNKQLYTLRKRITKGFSVRDDAFRDNEYNANEAVARTLLRIDKLMSEEYTQYLINFLNASAGVNVVPDRPGFVTDAVNNRTDIDASEWTAPIMGYIARAMLLNRIQNGIILTGSNLYETQYVDRANQANADGKGNVVLWNGMQWVFDLINVDGVNNPDQYTYLVSPNSYAIANKTWNPDAPFRTFDDIRYTMPSRFMPGMRYDVFYNNACQADASDEDSEGALQLQGADWREFLADNPNFRDGTFRSDALKHNYKVVLTAEAFLNPTGCNETTLGTTDADNTGILRFRNV